MDIVTLMKVCLCLQVVLINVVKKPEHLCNHETAVTRDCNNLALLLLIHPKQCEK